MTEILLRVFVKDHQNTKNIKVRNSYGRLGSIIGIITNLILCASKFILGSFVGSVAITADAINNLSDAGTSVISIVSFKLSATPADSEHPFGHARIEYISAMAVAILILFLGVEIGRNSVDAIINPVMIEFNMIMAVVLVVSILVKLWLYFFNRSLGRKIDSVVMLAVATDSLSDTLSTTVVLVSAFVSSYIGVPLDGYMGGAVSIFIFISGINIIKESLNKLLGDAPSKELVEEIHEFIIGYDGVIGIHDLVVHSYGPGRCFASVHVEVSANEDFLKSHDAIDNIERNILNEKQINLVIHLDPIIEDDPLIEMYKLCIESIVKEIDSSITLHDFRVVLGDSHNNFIFDMVIPFNYRLTQQELQNIMEEKLAEIHSNCYLVITFDH